MIGSAVSEEATNRRASAVRGGAKAAGGSADAIVRLNFAEVARRGSVGLGSVESLPLLDALMCLPHLCPVPVRDLAPRTRELLLNAPQGCVEWSGGGHDVTRLIVSPAAVDTVVVAADCWRRGVRRAQAFQPFATRVVLLNRLPRNAVDVAWEAQLLGVGLWVRTADDAREEVVAPEPFVQRFVKPASWRFCERAYAASLRSTPPRASSGARPDRRVRTETATDGQLTLLR